MKEIFIIKDCFSDFTNISEFFSKKDKRIKSFDFNELKEINGSQSTLIIHKKFEDSNGGNVRDYSGTQRSTNLCHREARLGVFTVFGQYHEKYGDILPELPEDVIVQKDNKRAFPASYRFPLWQQQEHHYLSRGRGRQQ